MENKVFFIAEISANHCGNFKLAKKLIKCAYVNGADAAWSLVMNYFLKKRSFRKVTGGSLSCNKGMIKIFKKTGMIQDGIRKNHELVKNKPFNIVYYAKFKNDKKQ